MVSVCCVVCAALFVRCYGLKRILRSEMPRSGLQLRFVLGGFIFDSTGKGGTRYVSFACEKLNEASVWVVVTVATNSTNATITTCNNNYHRRHNVHWSSDRR